MLSTVDSHFCSILCCWFWTMFRYGSLPPIFENRYRCDVIVRDHPTDLGLCYSDVILTWFFSCCASLHCHGPTQNDATDGWSAGLPDDMTSGCIDVRWCRRPLVLPPTHISCFEHNVHCALLPFRFPYVARPMTRLLFSSSSHYDLIYRKSRLPWTDVVVTEWRTYIPYATFCSAWDCLPYVLPSVGLLLETGVRTAIIRPTSKCFSNRRCEFVCVPVYLSCVKTEVGLHSNDVSL